MSHEPDGYNYRSLERFKVAVANYLDTEFRLPEPSWAWANHMVNEQEDLVSEAYRKKLDRVELGEAIFDLYHRAGVFKD
jgi:hypothetical protein